MKETILLINPPVIQEKTLNTQPIPLGLLSISKYLCQNGHDCKIVNLCNCKSWNDVIKNLSKKLDVNYVGIPCFTRQRFSVFKLTEVVKEINPKVKLWVGGPHATFLDETILAKYKSIDFIVRGEGEETIAYLVSSNFALEEIEGITFRNVNGEIVRNNDRKKCLKLENFPVPLQSIEELEDLNQSESLVFHFPNFRKRKLKIAPLISSRGCNGNCSFCCNKAYWGNQRYVNFDFLKEQIDYYYSKQIILFDVYDDNFTQNKCLVYKFTQYIIENNMHINWWCSSRVDTVDAELLSKMKQAGCFMISFGMESGSQYILDNIRKGISVEDILKAGKLANQVGLDFRVTISIGHTGESIETIKETITLINLIKPKQVALFILKVYPGTPIYEHMVKEQLISDEYWFNEKVPIVPFFTTENTVEELVNYKNLIENSIRATVLERYEDELGSVELTLEWGNTNE